MKSESTYGFLKLQGSERPEPRCSRGSPRLGGTEGASDWLSFPWRETARLLNYYCSP